MSLEKLYCCTIRTCGIFGVGTGLTIKESVYVNI